MGIIRNKIMGIYKTRIIINPKIQNRMKKRKNQKIMMRKKMICMRHNKIKINRNQMKVLFIKMIQISNG